MPPAGGSALTLHRCRLNAVRLTIGGRGMSGNASKKGAGCLQRELLCPNGHLLRCQLPNRSFLSRASQIRAPMPVCQASDLDPRTAVGALSLRPQDLKPDCRCTRHLSCRVSGVYDTGVQLLRSSTPCPSHFVRGFAHLNEPPRSFPGRCVYYTGKRSLTRDRSLDTETHRHGRCTGPGRL